MIKSKKLLTMICSGIFSAWLLCGCHADVHYQNRAVERARKFLLKEAADLDWKQQEFVRYSDPVLLHSHVLGSPLSSSEQRQICVTWQIPGKNELYMVFGVSGGRMANWYPERLLRRRYVTKSAPMTEVAKIAFDYAKSNLFHELSVEEMNRVRFSPPALLQTNFVIGVSAPAGASGEERAAFEENHGKKLQLTLCWKLDENRSVIFCGFGMPDLSQWQVARAGVISNKELLSRTERTILTPEQSLEKLPDLAARNRIGCECEHSENCLREGACKAAGKKGK